MGMVLNMVGGGGGGGYEIPQYAVSFLGLDNFTISAANNTPHWDGILEYSTNGKTWTTWDGTAISSQNGFLALRGTGNTRLSSSLFHNWVITGGKCFCSGNIETMLDWQTVEAGDHPTMASGCFVGLFKNCTNLLSAPELPATSLTYQCYSNMFNDSGITTAPTLPATTLADYCYQGMFAKCGALKTPPQLNAQTLANNCCENMFAGCYALSSAPALPALTLANQCYNLMFYSCKNILEPPNLPATTLAAGCYAQMFNNCASLNKLPALPALTLEDECYYRMFGNCTRIKVSTASGSPYTYSYRVPASGTGVDAEDALTDMFKGTSGTFVGTPAINTTYYTSNQIVS